MESFFYEKAAQKDKYLAINAGGSCRPSLCTKLYS